MYENRCKNYQHTTRPSGSSFLPLLPLLSPHLAELRSWRHEFPVSKGSPQDASSNGNPRILHLSSAGQHLYSPAPPLSHTGVAEYQPPPYFPPPTSSWLIRSRQIPIGSHPGEAYAAAISPLQQPAPTGSQQQAWPGARARRGLACPRTTGARPACCRTSRGWRPVP
jgi:hypothetical protein